MITDMSLAEAAARVRTSKTTIFRRIHAGKIRAAKNEFGEWRVQPDSLNGFRSRFGRHQLLRTDAALIAKLRDVASELLDLAATLQQRISERNT
jgi:excisionase family DNA binding protein